MAAVGAVSDRDAALSFGERGVTAASMEIGEDGGPHVREFEPRRRVEAFE